MKKVLFLLVVVLTGCVHKPLLTPLQQKQQNVINCVKDFKQEDIETNDAFEICRQVFDLKKVSEKTPTLVVPQGAK